jgi:hypothetical protein
MGRLYISDARVIIGYKDNRSFLRWCKYNGVGVLIDTGSNRKYVIAEELNAAKSYQAIRYLKSKYSSEEFPKAVQSYLNIQSEVLSALNRNAKSIIKPKYKPTGTKEISFIHRLQKIKGEL